MGYRSLFNLYILWGTDHRPPFFLTKKYKYLNLQSMLKRLKNFILKMGNKNKVQAPLYYQIGGEAAVLKLVERFYWHMDNDPKAKECRDLHAASLESASKKLFMFLSGWLGGPSLYIQAYGHPMMRRRHFPFKIAALHRDQWLYCMRKSMDELRLKKNLDRDLWQGFIKFAEHMRNS